MQGAAAAAERRSRASPKHRYSVTDPSARPGARHLQRLYMSKPPAPPLLRSSGEEDAPPLARIHHHLAPCPHGPPRAPASSPTAFRGYNHLCAQGRCNLIFGHAFAFLYRCSLHAKTTLWILPSTTMIRVRLCGFAKYPPLARPTPEQAHRLCGFWQVPRRPALSTTTFAMYIYTKTGPTSAPTMCVPLLSTEGVLD